jgi:hypothetical protein
LLYGGRYLWEKISAKKNRMLLEKLYKGFKILCGDHSILCGDHSLIFSALLRKICYALRQKQNQRIVETVGAHIQESKRVLEFALIVDQKEFKIFQKRD